MTMNSKKRRYSEAGVQQVRPEDGVLRQMCEQLRTTFNFSDRVLLDFGQFANVIKVSESMAIAITTDGVGTKILIAELMDNYDTIGIDCIAMNANDIICVGAKPVSMVDYIAVQEARPELLLGITKGLVRGAELAGISIPGGEISQVREMIKGVREGSGFDLVGTCIGTVHPEQIIIGEDVQAGDLVIGFRSNGIHSNGLTLARKFLLESGRYKVDQHSDELGKTIGEELLEPTRIYVKPIVEMLGSSIDVRALTHITSEGFLNLLRIPSHDRVGFILDDIPEPHPIFSLIQSVGSVPDEEMFLVYNMGIGFCVVVPESDRNATLEVAEKHGFKASVIGHTAAQAAGKVHIEQYGLVGSKAAGGFSKTT